MVRTEGRLDRARTILFAQATVGGWVAADGTGPVRRTRGYARVEFDGYRVA